MFFDRILKYSNVKMERGVTLIEMLTAVAIFSLITGAISGIFVFGIQTQSKILATQELLDQTSYVLEYMSRALRMAQKDANGACLTTCGAGCNYENPNLDFSVVRFINMYGICQEFLYENNQIKERKSTSDNAGDFPPSSTPLTSDKLKIDSLQFTFLGESETDDDLQPRATIFLEIEGREAAGSRPKIQIQTSVSQRTLDIP